MILYATILATSLLAGLAALLLIRSTTRARLVFLATALANAGLLLLLRRLEKRSRT